MNKVIFLMAISCLLVACSKNEACDSNLKKYETMMKDGKPFSEKDKLCFEAAMLKMQKEITDSGAGILKIPDEKAPQPAK